MTSNEFVQSNECEIAELRATIVQLNQDGLRSAEKGLRFIQWAQNREPWIGAIMIAYSEGGDLFKAVADFIDFEKRNPPPKL